MRSRSGHDGIAARRRARLPADRPREPRQGGGAPPIGIFILAYSLGHAGAFLPTPGGVGGTEGGLIGMFVAYGTPLDLAAAAVLAYRVFQLGLPAIFGAFALLRVRHTLAHPPPREVIEARFAAVAREDELD